MSGEAQETAGAAMEAVGSAQDVNNGKKVTKDFTPQDVESMILGAMRSRVSYLREKADSFTFESVRRLLEEDLGFEKYALDVHKSFVKQHLIQCLDGAGNDNASENAKETEREDVTIDKEAAESQSPKRRKSNKDVMGDSPKDGEKLEDSPVMGLLKGEKPIDSGAKETKEQEKKEVRETEIKKALMKRASYIKANSEKVTMSLLRRLLEEDLELEKHSLDIHKKFINEQLDEVLEAYEATEHGTTAKGKNLKKKSDEKASKKLNSEESSDSLDSEADGEEEEKKKPAQKRKLQKSAAPKKRKHVEETRVSAKKRRKPAETNSQSESDKAESETASDDGQTAEKAVTKKATAAPAYGKRVEHLKSVIKSCGMSVPPTVYRKVKQGPEDLREANLIKELEQILAKEGLSSNPSEKEIKEVKKRKDTARELEGIDMSNIVSSTRRRSTSLSFAPLPKPKIPDESKSDESEDSANDGDDDNDDGDDGDDGNDDGDDGDEQHEEEEEEDGDSEEGDEESSSEFEEDVEEESE